MSAYDEGLACEHEYMVGPPCGDPAEWVTPLGVALCDRHFETWGRCNGYRDYALLRGQFQRLPPLPERRPK